MSIKSRKTPMKYWTSPGSNTPQGAQLYGHLPPITKTIQARRTRHAGHCWRSKDEIVSDVLLWTPAYGQSKARRPARTFIQQLCDDTGCYSEDLPEVMNDKETWRERVRDIRASRTTWYIIYIYTGSLVYWVECSPLVRKISFNPRARHTKDFGLHINAHKQNICAIIKQATSPHFTEPLWMW